VRFTLRGSEEREEGVLQEWGEDYLLIVTSLGEQYMDDTMVTSLMRLTEASSTATSRGPAEQTISRAAGPPLAPHDAESFWQLRVETELDARIATATLKVAGADFKLVREVFDVLGLKAHTAPRSELDKAFNIYKYAHKVRELSRLLECTSLVGGLIRAHPDVDQLRLLQASLLAELAKFAEAYKVLDSADDTRVVGRQRAALALEAGRHADALGDLQSFFSVSDLRDFQLEWAVFLGLVIDGQTLGPLIHVLNAHEFAADAHLAVEAIAYCAERMSVTPALLRATVLPSVAEVRSALNAAVGTSGADAPPAEANTEQVVPGMPSDGATSVSDSIAGADTSGRRTANPGRPSRRWGRPGIGDPVHRPSARSSSW
jgi:hypothetical protein